MHITLIEQIFENIPKIKNLGTIQKKALKYYLPRYTQNNVENIVRNLYQPKLGIIKVRCQQKSIFFQKEKVSIPYLPDIYSVIPLLCWADQPNFARNRSSCRTQMALRTRRAASNRLYKPNAIVNPCLTYKNKSENIERNMY